MAWGRRVEGKAEGRGGEEGGGGGSRGVEQRQQWEDPLAIQPDRENELSQTNREVGGVCVGVVPRVQSKLSRAKKLLQDLQNLDNTTIKRAATVRFSGAWEKGAVTFVECMGASQEDTMEGRLYGKILGRSVRSHYAAEFDGMYPGDRCRQDTTHLHAISCTKTG